MSKTEIDREQEKNFNKFAIAQTFFGIPLANNIY